MKVAKLVYATIMTRVIVDVDADEQTIIETAVPKLSENLMDAPHENIEKIVDDTECPYELGEEYSLAVGDSIIAPEPNPDGTDDWNFGGWEGTILAIKEDTDGSIYADVQDADGDVFGINLDRIELY